MLLSNAAHKMASVFIDGSEISWGLGCDPKAWGQALFHLPPEWLSLSLAREHAADAHCIQRVVHVGVR